MSFRRRPGLKGNVREKPGADIVMKGLLAPYPASALLGIKAQKKR